MRVEGKYLFSPVDPVALGGSLFRQAKLIFNL